MFFAATEPAEELYDPSNDPETVKNLAGDTRYDRELQRLRNAQEKWMDETKDMGALSRRSSRQNAFCVRIHARDRTLPSGGRL